MKFRNLDTVVLNKDLSEVGLRRGDLGAVVQIYEPDGLEVEFVTASGRTEALVTLKVDEARFIGWKPDTAGWRKVRRQCWAATSAF